MGKEKILLTPGLAKEFLANNYELNRRPSVSCIEEYANDIKEGRWNPEVSRYQDPMLFTEDGRMIDGQHRCLAVIKANMPVYTYIEKNVDIKIFDYLDGGKKRNARDGLLVPNAHAAATLAKIMYAVENGNASLTLALNGKIKSEKNNTAVTRQQILFKHNEDPQRVQEFIHLGMKAAMYLGNKKGQISAALFVIDFCGRGDMISRFTDECSAIIPSAPSVIALRSYVARCLSQAHFKADYKWMCGNIFCAYEAFRNNTEIKSFNKSSIYFSQYDKYVSDARKESEKADFMEMLK